MDIKFRGKRKLNGEWVYGSLISIGNDWCQIVPIGTQYDDIGNSLIRVISETVGQFTGLKDKNKKDIYEGDIISTPKGICAVTFELGCFYAITVSRYRLGGWETNSIEIVGNVYESPQMLSSEQNPDGCDARDGHSKENAG